MRQEKRSLQRASVAELVDATDSKSVSGDRVGVRFPSAAPLFTSCICECSFGIRLFLASRVWDRWRDAHGYMPAIS